MRNILIILYIFLSTYCVYGQNTVSDIDGNVYKTIKIGSQVWMGENLKVTKYRNGDPIQQVTDNSSWINFTSGAYCFYYNNSDNFNLFGLLYNFYVIQDDRGIAPIGWHIPTKVEWIDLMSYIGQYSAGYKLRHFGGNYWHESKYYGTTTDEYGFNAYPSGKRDYNGNFETYGYMAAWWSTTIPFSKRVLAFALYYNELQGIMNSLIHNNEGLAIRCIKD